MEFFKPTFAKLALAALLLAAPAWADVRPPIQAWFGPHPLGSSRGLDTKFIEFVRSAEKTLDGSFYELRLDSLVAEFAAAHKRGVKVRLVVDDSNFYGKDESGAINKRKKNPFVKVLLDAGIEVKQDNNRRALMHNKFAIADGKRVWSGSYNLTDTCTAKNQNNGVWLESAAMATVFTRQFEEMYVKGEFGPKRTSTLGEQTVDVGGSKVEVLFAPEDDPLARQMELIKGAKKGVYFMQFAFTADEVANLMIERHKAGVDVKGILDHRLYRSTGPYSEFAKLTEAGVPVVVYAKGDGKFHHKVFIIDPGTDDGVVITGSENTSNNGNEANDENVLVIRDRKIVDQFAEEFSKLIGRLSTTQADLVYSELPISGETISAAELYVYSNGQPVSDVKVEFPPRWPVSAETISRMSATVGGKLLPAAQVKIEAKRATFTGVNLTPTGKGALMTVNLAELDIPKIPGGYSPLISVKGPDGDWHPLANQPTIKVYAADNPDAIGDMFDHLRVMFHKLGRLENMPGSDVEKMRAGWTKDFERLRKSVVSAAVAKRWKMVDATISQLEAFEEADRKVFGELTSNARELKRALAAHAGENETAAALLERLKALAGPVDKQ